MAVEIHTAGELHAAPNMPVPDFVFNLSRLLDDPARKPDADLVKLDGTDHRMRDFVFFTEGAVDLYDLMVRMIERQISRGKNVVVLILCRGGKHRSVAFGEDIAARFEVTPTHHHRRLPRVLGDIADIRYDSINATLIEQRAEAENKLHELRCALAEQVGRWSVGSAKEAQLSRVLESILREYR